MTRLPTPGQDNGTWGEILNDYLSKSHNTDGTLKSSAVAGAGAITQSQVESTVNTALGSLTTKYVSKNITGIDTALSFKDYALRPFFYQIASGGSQSYLLGHSVFSGTGLATMIKSSIQAIDLTATVTINGRPSYTST